MHLVPTLVHADVPFVAVTVPYMLDGAGSLFVLWGHAVRLSDVDQRGNAVVPLVTLARGELGGCAISKDNLTYCWAYLVPQDGRDPPQLLTGGAGFHGVAQTLRVREIVRMLTDMCALSMAGQVWCSGLTTNAVGIPPRDICVTVAAWS